MSTSARMPWGFVSAMSLTQLVSFGTIFYAFALFVEPMGQELGWSKSELIAAYSLALGTSALCAVPVGRLIDLGYGRAVMTGGSALAALLLALWSQVESYPAFVLIWAAMGLSMSSVFYEPGFAVLARRLGFLARRGITFMTLVGGFASTVFIPLTHLLIEHLGWRNTLLILAGLNLIICATIHFIAIPPALKKASHPASEQPLALSSSARSILLRASFWCFIASSVLQGLIAAGLPIHLIPLLTEKGYSLEMAVVAFSIIGPAQVAGRMAMAMGERAFGMKGIGVVTLSLGVLAFGCLPFLSPESWLVAPFAALFGASNGMMTIVRALLPPELFGRENYGVIQGMIAMPVRLTTASAPFLFGALWAWWGSYTGVMILWLSFSVASLGFYLAVLLLLKGREKPENSLALDG
ncbi:MFS transporter [Microvirga makkahensis]|uniref:MFS transporter n=1 Tax=Microvirga makkahensis TaxID=1128670 RepID=A0A7X3MTA5_9HYPH|nr:MFS transporter [Microvirga makkahensis]MXQ12866.1 MFS transporter [Microvirga makkahensis]